MIIDSKTPAGKRISVSIDETLYQFLEIAAPEHLTARNYIQLGIMSGEITNSATARIKIYKLILKPAILKEWAGNPAPEIQMDIEDHC